MLSRFYRYISTQGNEAASHDIEQEHINAEVQEEQIKKALGLTRAEQEGEDVEDLIHSFEGDSLIIDEARSGPISSSQEISPINQYGTSFADASDFKTGSSYKIVKFNSDQEFLIDFNHKNDYENKINKFYLPSVPRFEVPRYEEELLQQRRDEFEQYKYTIDERLEDIQKEKKAKLSEIKPLVSDQFRKVARIFNDEGLSRLVISKYQIDITVKDMKTLRPGTWLNDNVIDYYFNLISDQNQGYFSWTSHFFTTLKSRGYAGVKRWGKRKKLNLFEKSLVFIPINISSTHWALSVINNETKTIAYYDSLSFMGADDSDDDTPQPLFSGLQIIKTYMDGEKERLGLQVDVDEYEMLPNILVPQQQNGYDCGVFTCVCASYLAKTRPLKYSQKDMPIFRQRIAYEILTGELL